jgi:hypothetical protein
MFLLESPLNIWEDFFLYIIWKYEFNYIPLSYNQKTK